MNEFLKTPHDLCIVDRRGLQRLTKTAIIPLECRSNYTNPQKKRQIRPG